MKQESMIDSAGRLDDNTQGRKRWLPEASEEAATALRLLAVRPWLIAGRDDNGIAAVRRNLPAIRETLVRLGWVLVVERDFVRLRKSPPIRRDAWAVNGPNPLQASWFFLLVAAAESMPPRAGLAQLVTAARAAAAEAGLRVTHDITERRAIIRALRMLDDRGVLTQMDGDLENFAEDEDAPVLIAVHHTRLAHVIANFGSVDPATESKEWLDQVEREPDPARRMRRKLVDDALVHASDLDEAEADWLSRRVRGDDGAPLASAFGLKLERRTEGAAFVVPEDAFRYLHELGAVPFPSAGTVPHAALLLCEYASATGVSATAAGSPGTGWRGLPERSAIERVAALASERQGQGGWQRELVQDPRRLCEEVRSRLMSLDLLRVLSTENAESIWWFSPAVMRWAPVPEHQPSLASAPEEQLDLLTTFKREDEDLQ